MDTSFIPWIFAAIMIIGVTYLLISTVFGGLVDLDADFDADIDGVLDGLDGVNTDSSVEARGLGCSVISAFLAGFGSIGLLGTLSGWALPLSLIVALMAGLIFGRGVMGVLRYVTRQQSSALVTTESLIGNFARITVDVPAGHIGEALLETDTLTKYPVKAVSDTLELKKGDYVEVVDIQQGRLYVKKKRFED